MNAPAADGGLPEEMTTGLNDGPIGVFDSGIGGLTVLREIVRLLPGEDTVYLGDTARVPYGIKSRQTVVRYALEDAGFLAARGVKLMVVACNTASAYALDELKEMAGVPVVGVITPGAGAAVSETRSRKVGVIGTEATIRSSSYVSAIRSIDGGIEVLTRACPLFVPLAEEGWTDNEVARLVAAEYLKDFRAGNGVDVVVLGCTHYPVLKETISGVLGPGVRLIDSAEATAREVKRVLESEGLAASGKKATHTFHVTDSPERFVQVGRRFFGGRLTGAELVDITEGF